MFPVSNSSQTIIDCFLNEAKQHQVALYYNHAVRGIEQSPNHCFTITTTQGLFKAKKIVVATGSNPKMWQMLTNLGHHVSAPVPSLFTFHIEDARIKTIPGVVVQDVSVSVLGTDLWSEGPLLITHWGLSAPSILKLSAFGALELAQRDYKFDIEINFIKKTFGECLIELKTFKQSLAKKTVYKSTACQQLPKRLWHQLVLASGIKEETRWADVNKQQLEGLAKELTQAAFSVTGKSTFKDEFVTAGGLQLKEVNFKTFESKYIPNMYFAGEVLNVDAITGGFNFQNALTGAFIVAKSICASV